MLTKFITPAGHNSVKPLSGLPESGPAGTKDKVIIPRMRLLRDARKDKFVRKDS